MPNERKISRREWFCLGTAPAPTPATDNQAVSRREPAIGDESPALQEVDAPVNHDGMDLSELPPMREALLSAGQVRELFSDIAALATDVLLMQRPAGAVRATAAKATTAEQLQSAEKSLIAGELPRLQIRYHWQQQNWIDTLERQADGFRLIRIAHKLPA